MSPLLSLPQEIRDSIIEMVLLSSRPAPTNVATAARDRMEPLLLTTYEKRREASIRAWDYGPSHVRFERTQYISNDNALRLVNRQLCAETNSALSRLSSAGRSYTLDVLLVNEHELWPTWLCVPALTEEVDTIDVTFRIFGSGKDSTEHSALIIGDGSPPSIEWCFYYLLEHFLDFGPLPLRQRPESKPKKSRVIRIQTLNVNFTAGDTHLLPPPSDQEFSRAWFMIERQRGYRRETGQSDDPGYIIPPERLTKTISRQISSLLSMHYHTATYGGLLNEHIGMIRVAVNGELHEEFDVGIRLAALSYSPKPYTPNAGSEWYTGDTFGHLPGEQRLPEFWKWKKGAVQKRKKRGLAMPDPIVMPEPHEMKRLKQACRREAIRAKREFSRLRM